MSVPGRADVTLRGASDHEALLRRHGLISHVALLPDDAPPEVAARFQAEASRVARNLIALAPRRFGVLLDAPDSVLSDVAYTLLAECDAPATPPTAKAAETRQASGAADDPGIVSAATPGPGGSGSVSAGLTGPADAADGTPLARPARSRTEGTAEERSDDAPTQWADDRAIDTAGALSRLAARLDRIEARLESLDVNAPNIDTVVAAAVPALDDLLGARIDALEARLRSDAVPFADPFPPDRVDSFWAGLEQAVRLLHAQLSALDAVSDRLAAPSPARDSSDLGEIEAAVALGFEAAGEAREANQAALDARLASLESGSASLAESLLTALAALGDRLGPVEAALAEPLRSERDAALVAAIGSMGDRIAALVDERLPLVASTTEAAEGGPVARLSELVEDALQGLARIDAGLSALRDGETLPPPETKAEADRFAALETGIAGLAARLEERGGILSDALETSHRSMKNFWLAAENALGRLDVGLDRLSAAASPSETLLARLDAITARLERGERENADLRLALAELLARTECAGTWRADRDQIR